jgi:hypothetical protein
MQTSLPGTESTISGFLKYGRSREHLSGTKSSVALTPPLRPGNSSPQISVGPAGTLKDHSYPPKGLQITGHNAIGPRGRYHLTRSGSVTATKEITADADPQAPTSPSPLVLDLTTMSVVVPRKLGPKSDAEKSASEQLRQAGGACMKHRLKKKRVSPHCPPKIKNPR